MRATEGAQKRYKYRTVVFAFSIGFMLPNAIWATPFPQPLPEAPNFELTIREDPGGSLPLGPSCGGEAALTLACRAFVVTLRNISVHTVHLSRIACEEPAVNFEMKDPNSSTRWWPISDMLGSLCTPWVYENLRLRRGKATEYRTRLVSKSRPAELWLHWAPGSYTIRARWLLRGCTEEPEGTDCLAPLQVLKTNPWSGPPTGDVETQKPVEIVSNEIEVSSPVLPDLGPLKLGYAVTVVPTLQAAEMRKQYDRNCAADPGTSIECTVFRYSIRNLAHRPLRNGSSSCNDFSIIPEYRTDGGEWKPLGSGLTECSANIYRETPIQPGATTEREFTLRALPARFDASPLYPAGKYEIRFRFRSNACWASSDGSFCIQRPNEQVKLVSNVLTINATVFAANGSSPE